jgi:hypothetical protein
MSSDLVEGVQEDAAQLGRELLRGIGRQKVG